MLRPRPPRSCLSPSEQRLVFSGTVVKLAPNSTEDKTGRAALFERHPSFANYPPVRRRRRRRRRHCCSRSRTRQRGLVKRVAPPIEARRLSLPPIADPPPRPGYDLLRVRFTDYGSLPLA